MPFCQGTNSLPMVYKISCQGVCNLEHFQGQKSDCFYMYIESVMISGCKNADTVGSHLGALP